MRAIDVSCERSGSGWECHVAVHDDGETRHRVHVSHLDLERLAPGATDPEELVRASFDFLLQRESKESILRVFDLTVIGRYFPEYEREIVRRLTR